MPRRSLGGHVAAGGATYRGIPAYAAFLAAVILVGTSTTAAAGEHVRG